jgi:hypothetical protein
MRNKIKEVYNDEDITDEDFQTLIKIVVFCKRKFPIFAKIFPQVPVGNFFVCARHGR